MAGISVCDRKGRESAWYGVQFDPYSGHIHAAFIMGQAQFLGAREQAGDVTVSKSESREVGVFIGSGFELHFAMIEFECIRVGCRRLEVEDFLPPRGGTHSVS